MEMCFIRILRMDSQGCYGDLPSWCCSLYNFRTITSAKGSVKKIRFAPGKGNTKILILYNNRVDVRDALEVGVATVREWLPSCNRKKCVARSSGDVVRHV